MGSNNHMHNFTTLMKRLEAATSRLEDMASTFDGTSSTPVVAPTTQDATSESSQKSGSPDASTTPQALPRSMETLDTFVNTQVKKFVDISQELGDPVAAQSKAVLHAFEAVRTYLFVTTKAKKPEPPPAELMTDLHVASDEINNLRESNRASPQFTHLSMVAEGAVSMGWLFENKPAEFIKDVFPAAQFYGNRILKEYKDKDDLQVAYIQAFYDMCRGAIDFTDEYYPRGVSWNPDGVDVMEALKQVKQPQQQPAENAAPAPPPPPLPNFDLSGGAPPPPPPPPPPGGAAPAPKSSGGPDMTAVFEQLNQGSDVTSNLRKVDKSEMTHKNPSLRTSSTVPERSDSQTKSPPRGKSPAPVPGKKPKPENLRAKKIPRKHLDGNKWFIEHHESPEEVIDISAHLTQSILVSRCHKTILKVSNKANAIQVDNCTELSIILDSLVSSIEVIKSPKFALQIDGTVPTVVLDQVDGATIYISKESLNTELFTSKCAATNVVLPPEEDTDGDSKECPLPEQIKSSVKNGQVVSEIVDHAG